MMIRANFLPPEQIAALVQSQVVQVVRNFERKYGRRPGKADIAWVCRRAEKCGWWADELEKLVGEDFQEARDGSPILVPGERPRVRVRIVCPQCGSELSAIEKKRFMEAASRQGHLTELLAHKSSVITPN